MLAQSKNSKNRSLDDDGLDRVKFIAHKFVQLKFLGNTSVPTYLAKFLRVFSSILLHASWLSAFFKIPKLYCVYEIAKHAIEEMKAGPGLLSMNCSAYLGWK